MPTSKPTAVAGEDPNALAANNKELKPIVDSLEKSVSTASDKTMSQAEIQALKAELAEIKGMIYNSPGAKLERAVDGMKEGASNLTKMGVHKIAEGWSHFTDIKNSEILAGAKAVDQAVTEFGNDIKRDASRAISDAKESRANSVQRQVDNGLSTGTLGGDLQAVGGAIGGAISYGAEAVGKGVMTGASAVGGAVVGVGALGVTAGIKGYHMAGDTAQAIGGAAVDTYKRADDYVVNKSNAAGEVIKSGVQAVDQAVTEFGNDIKRDASRAISDAKESRANSVQRQVDNGLSTGTLGGDLQAVGGAIKSGVQAVDQAVTNYGKGLEEDISASRSDLRNAVATKANEKIEAANALGNKIANREELNSFMDTSKSMIEEKVIKQKAMSKPLDDVTKGIIYKKLAGNPAFSGENKKDFNNLDELKNILSENGLDEQEEEAIDEIMALIVSNQKLSVTDQLKVKKGEVITGVYQAKNNLANTVDKAKQTANQVAGKAINYGNTDVKKVWQDMNTVDISAPLMKGLKDLFSRKNKKEDN